MDTKLNQLKCIYFSIENVYERHIQVKHKKIQFFFLENNRNAVK